MPPEPVYGTPDYLAYDERTRSWVPDPSWSEGLASTERDQVVAAGGDVVFTTDGRGRSVVYHDADGNIVTPGALERRYGPLPLWGWLALGLGLYLAGR